MQVFDKKWVGQVEGSAMKIDLYLRYMDDGKIVLCPLKGHWVGFTLVWSIARNGI